MLQCCRRARPTRVLLAAWLTATTIAVPGTAQAVVPGDLDGDGAVAVQDLVTLFTLQGATTGDSLYDPSADLDGSGEIDSSDISLLYALLGNTGAPDSEVPQLAISLNHIPQDQNAVLVVPPDGFQVTLEFDSAGGSLIDKESLVVTSNEVFGPHGVGSDLASEFAVTPTGAIWTIPGGYDLLRRTHYLAAWITDAAGNTAWAIFGFAVRDFVSGPPMGNPQTVFLDFDQDRNLGPEIDFLESLRQFGLSDPSMPGLEATLYSLAASQIVSKVGRQYGLQANGAPGPDSPPLTFVRVAPAGPHARICVGGQSPAGAPYLGSANHDENNLVENSDECNVGASFGVFPHAIANLWGADPDYQEIFASTHPGLGGVPIGLHPLDAQIFVLGFSSVKATPAQRARLDAVARAFHAFTWAVATAASHEIGHMFGLTATGSPGGGMFGDALNHNLTASGGVPSENWVMNPGGTFSFAEVAALESEGMAVFRPFSWAYLRDRVAPNPFVTALYPAPSIDQVEPSILVFQGQLLTITVHGGGFQVGNPPSISLARQGDPTPEPVFNINVIDTETVTGDVNQFFVTSGPYDVVLMNPDGQIATLEDGVVVP